MSTLNMKPHNLLILAALGIGAYWFVTRQARAGSTGQAAGRQYMTSPARASVSPGAQPAQVGAADYINLATAWLKKTTGQDTTAPAPVINIDTSSSADGIAVNPANGYNDPSAINGYF